jgi:hypothetical protein
VGQNSQVIPTQSLLRSCVHLQLVRRRGGEPSVLGTATGFVVASKKSDCLVTCAHTLTNRRADDAAWIGSPGRPDAVAVLFPTTDPKRWIKAFYPLMEQGRESFTQHPRIGDADIAVLPIQLPEGVDIVRVRLQSISRPDPVSLGTRLMVPGFPLGLHSPSEPPRAEAFGGHPICKTVHLATPIDYDHEGKPLALIDGTCRSGMSGSPVFVETDGGWICYGVFAAQHEEAELGQVVKVTALSECLSEARKTYVRGCEPLEVRRSIS